MNIAAVAPVLQQLVQVISQLTQVLGKSGAVAGAQGGAAGVQAGGPGTTAGASGGGAVAGASGGPKHVEPAPTDGAGATPRPVDGGGPTQGPGGCGCGGASDAAAGPNQNSAPPASAGTGPAAHGAPDAPPEAPAAPAPAAPPAPSGPGGIKGPGDLTVKKQKITDEQVKLANEVLKVGKEMGASDKVLRASVATMIQESGLKNLDYGDRDSQGLFQQRPSQGWGTVAQVRDPKHAANEFFKRAIAKDKANPNFSIAQLSQSVQISAFPSAYAQWEGEANKIVGAFNAG